MLQSINVFALELFRQFPDILGVRTRSFMTGLTNGLPQAIDNAFDGALHRSAAVQILSTERNGDEITAAIKVTNLVGHRLPSGVGFRRLILEFDVVGADQQVVWSSGRTNSLGVVVDEHGEPLPSEFHAVDPHTGAQAYQPHYQVVDSQSRAQIYEELLRDSTGAFTTSFLARAEDVGQSSPPPAGRARSAGLLPSTPEATARGVRGCGFHRQDGLGLITCVAPLPAKRVDAVTRCATSTRRAFRRAISTILPTRPTVRDAAALPDQSSRRREDVFPGEAAAGIEQRDRRGFMTTDSTGRPL